MSEEPTHTIPEPVDGRFIFQIDQNIRVRFNADGWVEEIGKGGSDDPLGTKLQGKSGSKLDDIFARRYYDLYSRIVLFDVHAKQSSDKTAAQGFILFKDLEPGSHIHDRINLVISIANHHFNMGIKPLLKA